MPTARSVKESRPIRDKTEGGISMSGTYIRTEEHKRLFASIRYSRRGIKHSEEAKKKMSDSMQDKGRIGALARWGKFNTEPKQLKLEFNKRERKLTDQEKLEHKRFWNQRYKMRKRKVEGNHTLEEWLVLKELYGNMCLCCKRKEPEIRLSEDHIIPLSMGGTDYIHNIQPLCTRCNTSKFTKTIDYRSSDSNSYQYKN